MFCLVLKISVLVLVMVIGWKLDLLRGEVMKIYYGLELINTAIDTAFLVLFEDEEKANKACYMCDMFPKSREHILELAQSWNEDFVNNGSCVYDWIAKYTPLVVDC